MLIGFDVSHTTESMRKIVFQVNSCMMEFGYSFVNLQVKKTSQGTNTRDLEWEKHKRATHGDLPCLGLWLLPINMEAFAGGSLCFSFFHLYCCQLPPGAFLVLLFLWTRVWLWVLRYLTHARGRRALGVSRQKAGWPGAVWVYLTGDSVSHPIPLSPDQLRPRWLSSVPVPRVKRGRLYHGRCAHNTYFQDEWKPRPIILFPPFLLVFFLFCIVFLPDIFLTVSLNFSNSLLYLHAPFYTYTAPIGRKTHHTAIF